MAAPRTLDTPARDRAEAALDFALSALRELLACAELADNDCGVPESRHQAAKRAAHRAIRQIETLREGRER